MNLVAGIDAGLFAGLKLLDSAAPGFPGYGPDGVAAFTGVEIGFKLTLTWASDVRPHADGTEQRASTLDRPKQHFDGQVKLLGNAPRGLRAKLARYAAANVPFLLGLPWESLPLLDDADGAELTVSSTWLAKSDWNQVGQRVIVRAGTESTTAVLQSASGSTITLDVAPGSAGAAGGEVMPAMAIYLEPQQDFARAKVNAETWNLSARAAIFDFAPTHATLDLGAIHPALAGAILMFRESGLVGNTYQALLNTFGVGDPVVIDADAPPEIEMFVVGDVATLGDLAAALETQSNLARLVGDYDPATVIPAAVGIALTPLSGGSATGAMGRGAVLTQYAGLPVWDRPLANAGAAADPVHALSEIIDLGGVPYPIGQADYPVYGRALTISSDDPDDWQWLKLFLSTVRGAQGVWWLPTYRADLTWVSSGALSLTVRSDDDSDIGAWYPKQRDRLMVRQVDGTVTYLQVTGAIVDNGDGTQTLTVDATLSAEDVELVCWLEPCRFQSDTFEITWGTGRTFSMSAPAQAHAVTDPDLGEIE